MAKKKPIKVSLHLDTDGLTDEAWANVENKIESNSIDYDYDTYETSQSWKIILKDKKQLLKLKKSLKRYKRITWL